MAKYRPKTFLNVVKQVNGAPCSSLKSNTNEYSTSYSKWINWLQVSYLQNEKIFTSKKSLASSTIP